MSYKSWKSGLAEKSETIIKDVWPELATRLTDTITSERLSLKRIPDVRKAGIVRLENGEEHKPVIVGAKRKRSIEVTTNGDHKHKIDELPASKVKFIENPIITEAFAEEKDLILDLVDQIQTVRMWITFNVPKIEDGNNFGVSVQEEILNELKTCEAEFEALLSSPSSYYASRGKVISKCLKYPEIVDYQHYVEEVDEKVYLMHRMTLTDIRNSLATLLDLLDKNMDKIKKPKGSKYTNMY